MPRKPTSTNPYAIAARERMRRMAERRRTQAEQPKSVVATVEQPKPIVAAKVLSIEEQPKAIRIVASVPTPEWVKKTYDEAEDWIPENMRLAGRVQAQLCNSCPKQGSSQCVEQPCLQYRRMYSDLVEQEKQSSTSTA